MIYEINVSKDGVHFFATSKRSIKTFSEVLTVYPIIKKKFPKSEGYELEVYEWKESGKKIKDKTIMELAK